MHQKYKLPSGVRIVAENIPYAYSAVIGIWLKTGSRNEDDGNRGVSHFIEHLLFKGTANRTAKQIAEELEAIGGTLNAFTAKEYTCFYAKVLAEHLPVAIDLLRDMLFNSTFAEADIEKERNVVLEEIKMYEDTPDELIHDLFVANVWQKHSLGYPILGSIDSVEQLEHQTIKDYFQKHYIPSNTVIAVAGKIDCDQVFAELENAFDHWSHTKNQLQKEEPPVSQAREVYYQKDTEQVHLCLGTPSLAQDDERIYSMIVLNSIIGGGLSSRLFQSIREERGLAYSVYSYHSAYIDAGLFSIYAGTRPKNAVQVVGLIFEELKEIRKQGITIEELNRIKQQIKGSVLLSMESIGNRMSRLGRTEVSYGRVIRSEEVINGITKVTLPEVNSLAEQLFLGSNFSLTAIGPEKPTTDWLNLLKETLF